MIDKLAEYGVSQDLIADRGLQFSDYPVSPLKAPLYLRHTYAKAA